MEAREPIKITDVSLTRGLTHVARYYLGTRRAMVAIAVVVAAAGIALNWGWLVAAGIAPILLSTLPYLIMCGLGYCMMCHSNKTQSAASREIADSTISSTAPGVAEMDRSAVGGSSKTPSSQVKQLQPTEERKDSHA